MDAIDELDRGRESYARRAWLDAYASLSLADKTAPLGAEDLELLATAAYMLGREDEHVSGLERAHHAHLETAEALRAARCAFWIGVNLMLREEMARASGWLGRVQRLVERHGHDCVERGYLLLPVVVGQVEADDGDAAYVTATAMTDIGARFGDADLTTLGVHWQGQALVRQEQIGAGLRRLDEAMVAITAGEWSPILTGLIYCSVIDGCRQVYALRQAQEWTTALTRWCDRQPGIVAFTGPCLVHRAEIMQLHGTWRDALDEARQAEQRFAAGMHRAAAAEAVYRQGELHRLRGDFAEAEEAYRDGSRLGWEPQPGLALLRLAQGNGGAAAAAIRRVLGETSDRLQRAGLLGACAEIMLAAGEIEEARAACHELEDIAERSESSMLGAMAAHARGAIELSGGDARAALAALRRACEAWQELGVPYEAARVRALLGLACRALGDDDAAGWDLDAAREAFARLGAAPDLARIDLLTGRARTAADHGLTARELQVLRLVAAGRSNREIGAALIISEHTVARHVQNIFAKLGVSSRTAAGAYAYEHHLV